MTAKAIGRPADHTRNSTQKKPKYQRRNSGWPNNAYGLVALCVIAAVLIAAVGLGFDRLQLSGYKNESGAQFAANSSPGPAPNANSATVTVDKIDAVSWQDAMTPATSAIERVDHQQAGAVPEEQEKEPSGKSMLAGFLDEGSVPGSSGTAGVANYADAQGVEWVDDLYAQLNSLEPSAADTSPVISGRVLTRSGRPVSGIEVSAQLREYFKTGNSDAHARKSGAQQTTTNSNGFYAFRDLPAGIYMISARESGGYAPARIEVRTGVKYADLVLDPQRSAQIRGIVTDPMGTQLAGVRVMPLVKGIPKGAVSNNDGKFEFDVALQGETRSFPVRFQLEGYREQRYQVAETDWPEDGRLALAVAMEPVYDFSTVTGSLKDSAGNQITGETVRLYSPSLKRNYRAASDGGGAFAFANVETADDYQLWIRPTGPYRDFTEQNLQLSQQGSVHRDIELESLDRGYRLTGRILDLDGKPVPEFTLRLRSKAASGPECVKTNQIEPVRPWLLAMVNNVVKLGRVIDLLASNSR